MAGDPPPDKASGKPAWRQERPSEDPDKMKRWGIISAQPSEYLIHYRNGRLREKSSGQGASCFKWPTDTVAIVPTTIKEVFFQANQITRDNVDVRIKGMAFYHIADPLRIYKRINFSFRERAEEKLAATFSDMCRSQAKWLVANMTVEEAIRKRKEEIATTLKSEVEQVVSRDGGWGIVIDTIDIQDIFIVSDEIFQALQQEYRSRTRVEAERSRIEAERELRQKELENQKTLNFLRIQTEQEIREREIANKKQAALLELAADTETRLQGIRGEEQVEEADKEKESRQLALASRHRISAIQHQLQEEAAAIGADAERLRQEGERDRAQIEMRRALDTLQLELDQLRVEVNNKIALDKAEAESRCEAVRADQAARGRALGIKGDGLANDELVRYRRLISEIENSIGDNRIREIFVSQSLPEIARAFAAQFGQIRYTQLGGSGDASPLGGLAAVFNQLLEVAQLHGIDLPGLLAPKEKKSGKNRQD